MGAQILEFTAEIKLCPKWQLSLFRFTGSCGQVLLTDKSQFHCPKTEKIHLTVGDPELLGVCISTKPWHPTLPSRILSPLRPSSSAVSGVSQTCFRNWSPQRQWDRKLKSTLENKRIGSALRRRSLVPWDASLAPFKSSPMSPKFNTWFGWYTDCKPGFNSHEFPESCFITTGTSSQKTHVLSLGYIAVNVQSYYKSVQHPPSFSLSLPSSFYSRYCR